ncbi:MAG: serine/threonine protein kinase [Deltaproteobacteria bacterium]|nr:serine/threonine protein kinase [Deltaproteobacteria bacterium]
MDQPHLPQRVCPLCETLTDEANCPNDGTPTAEATSPSLPRVGGLIAGRYRVTRELSRGGFGVVYVAYHINNKQEYAIKLLRPGLQQNKETEARFLAEAVITAKLSHPNTVRVFDSGVTPEGDLYMAMEFLNGHVLERDLAGHQRLEPRHAVKVAVQVLKSLQEAHSKNFVHRDLKPDNIFLCDIGGEDEPFVKVIDWGIAKALRNVGQAALTQTGTIFGTPHYMSPEQVMGTAMDGRSDLYSLGIILFRCLTGQQPYMATDQIALCFAHVHAQPLALSEFVPGIDPRLEALVARALAKSPDDRFESAAAMRAALEQWLAEPAPQRALPVTPAPIAPVLASQPLPPEPPTAPMPAPLRKPVTPTPPVPSQTAPVVAPPGEAPETTQGIASASGKSGVPALVVAALLALVVAVVVAIVWYGTGSHEPDSVSPPDADTETESYTDTGDDADSGDCVDDGDCGGDTDACDADDCGGREDEKPSPGGGYPPPPPPPPPCQSKDPAIFCGSCLTDSQDWCTRCKSSPFAKHWQDRCEPCKSQDAAVFCRQFCPEDQTRWCKSCPHTDSSKCPSDDPCKAQDPALFCKQFCADDRSHWCSTCASKSKELYCSNCSDAPNAEWCKACVDRDPARCPPPDPCKSSDPAVLCAQFCPNVKAWCDKCPDADSAHCPCRDFDCAAPAAGPPHGPWCKCAKTRCPSHKDYRCHCIVDRNKASLEDLCDCFPSDPLCH